MLCVAIIGISGYGAILTDLLRSFAARGKIRFVAAAVINHEEESLRCRLLERENVRIFEDYREMLSVVGPKIDLCIVPVGIPWHASIAIDVLKAGCHVLLEKPIAGNYADAVRICNAAKDSKRHLLVGFQDISDPGVWAIKDFLLKGLLGEILEIRAAGAWPRSIEYFKRNAWAGKLAFDGMPVRDSPHNNALAHLVNLSFFWAGRSRSEYGWPKAASGFLYRFLPIESFDTGWVQWDLDDGPSIVCAASHASEKTVSPQIFIRGTAGSLLWDYECGLLKCSVPLRPPSRPHLLSLRELSLDSAFKFLQGGPSLQCSGENALSHARAIDLAHGSLPIQGRLTTEMQIEHRDGDEYHFVRDLDRWFRIALSPAVTPQPIGGNASNQRDFQPTAFPEPA